MYDGWAQWRGCSRRKQREMRALTCPGRQIHDQVRVRDEGSADYATQQTSLGAGAGPDDNVAAAALVANCNERDSTTCRAILT